MRMGERPGRARLRGMNPWPPHAAFLRYDRISIMLHWITALVIAGLFLAGEALKITAGTQAAAAIANLHAGIGLSVPFLVLARLWLRATRGTPPLPGTMPLIMHRLAPLGHGLLYVLMLVASGFGLLAAMTGDGDPRPFGLFSLPHLDATLLLGEGEAWEAGKGFAELHEVSAWTLVIVSGFHALLTLAHHYWHDRTYLRRMS